MKKMVSFLVVFILLAGVVQAQLPTPPPPAFASCTDNELNQDETGVDCGGVCPPCPASDPATPNQDNESPPVAEPASEPVAAVSQPIPDPQPIEEQTPSVQPPQDGSNVEESKKSNTLLIIVIVIIAFLAVLAAVFFLRKRKANAQLQAYVSNELRAGYNEQQIRQALIKAGNPQKDIDGAFASLKDGVRKNI